MDELKSCAGGCGVRADKSVMHYRPERVNGFVREWYYCDKCNEKRHRLAMLKSTTLKVRKHIRTNIHRSHY